MDNELLDFFKKKELEKKTFANIGNTMGYFAKRNKDEYGLSSLGQLFIVETFEELKEEYKKTTGESAESYFNEDDTQFVEVYLYEAIEDNGECEGVYMIIA